MTRQKGWGLSLPGSLTSGGCHYQTKIFSNTGGNSKIIPKFAEDVIRTYLAASINNL